MTQKSTNNASMIYKLKNNIEITSTLQSTRSPLQCQFIMAYIGFIHHNIL